MSKRIIEITEEIKLNNGELDLKALSKKLEINERTIRYDIEIINEKLTSMNLREIKKVKKGIFKGEVDDLVFFLNEDKELHRELIKDYKKEIILILSAFEGELNISKLCEELDLGRTTVKSTIKEIKTILDLYKLELVVEAQKGLKLIGDERDIRRLQLKLLNKYNPEKSLNFENKYLGRWLSKYVEGIHEANIKKFIEFILNSLDRVISDEAYDIILNYITIIIMRVKNNISLDSSKNENFFYETVEFKAIEKACVLLEAEFNIKLNSFELLGITDYFMGSHLYSKNSSFLKNWIEVEVLTKRLIDEFSRLSNHDLSNDTSLLEGLINHMKPTIYRIKNNIELENSITEEFKSHYPKILENTLKSIEVVREFSKVEFPLDEAAFIGMYFKSALDRSISKKNESKKILIVCAMGYGTSKFIAQQIRERYQVNIIDIIPQNQLSRYTRTKDIDFIVSTSIIAPSYKGIPVLKVDPILDTKDFTLLEANHFSRYTNKIPLSMIVGQIEKNTRIENYKGLLDDLKKICSKFIINDIKSKYLKIVDLLTDETISIETSSHTWEEAITKTGQILENNKITDSSYTKKMIDSITLNGSYMITDEGLALPHAKNTGDVHKTGMALVIFKEKVVFPDNKSVKAILAFSSIDGREHLDPLTEFINLVKKYEFMEFLEKVTTKRRVVERIKKYNFLSKLGSS